MESNNTNETADTTTTDPVTTDEVTPTEVVVETTPASATPETETATAPETTAALSADTPTSAHDTNTTPTNSPRRQVVIQYGVAFLIVAAMGVGLWYALEEQGRVQTGAFDAVKALVVSEPAVATVNGEPITVVMVEKNKQQLSMAAVNQGLDPNAPDVAAQIQTQSVDLLINTELLRQAAVEAGIVVSAEDVSARYNEIVTQLGGEEALSARMTELGITPESLQSDIEGELLIQKYIESAVDTSSITISEEEIVAFYEQVGGGSNPEFPPLDEVRPQIEFELRNQQEQQLISDHIATLKEAAVIEML